ncbi:hypothetical protein BO79DRAFT_63409 [Aspergillus costaricaensis CBS 115574]|uniref:Uncharacterized protein n=1 Tax=Aspergillus costaricaensis CBS 115574 TaxID=1448317 RepID=A0ACD1INX2_9EURO|nr:hypothetical protein BO79DRAFT_63409 [Aspergillus costaricaensis CBS 115574]RAK92266.1 hypothetical protein BO79DRAFT_63409 [Aspergillus costaricaensis CBS 115574]
MGWHALDSRHRPPDNAALQRCYPLLSLVCLSLSPLPSVPLRIVAPDSCLALPSRLPSGLDFLSRSLYTIVPLFVFLTPFFGFPTPCPCIIWFLLPFRRFRVPVAPCLLTL